MLGDCCILVHADVHFKWYKCVIHLSQKSWCFRKKFHVYYVASHIHCYGVSFMGSRKLGLWDMLIFRFYLCVIEQRAIHLTNELSIEMTSLTRFILYFC